MGLSTLAVIFVGLAGGHHGKVEKQVGMLVKQLHVTMRPMTADSVRVLTHHDATTRDFVRKLDTDGVIACEVTNQGALRVVVYDRDGKLLSFSDSPLDHEQLSADDLTVLRDNLITNLESITGEAVVVEPPAAAQAPKVKAKPEPEPEIEIDPTPAAPAADDDAVSVDDIAALTAATDDEPPTAIEETAAASGEPELHLGIAAGIGVTTRNFAAAPSAVAGYSSSAVAAVHLDVDIAPTTRTELRLSTERTLGMTTPTTLGDAATSVSRWEATGGYVFGLGRFAMIPTVGLGRRAFSVDAMDQTAPADNVYDYLMLGATARIELGKRVALHAIAAFEPVVGGEESTEMALGEANRWSVDAGARVDVKVGEHAHLRAAADYQNFHWVWKMAGERGAGGASDTYLTASLSIGAEY
jgi:hypothetical protein